MQTKIKLHYVHYMPRDLDAGVLYYSKEYAVAIHLCPCGCGTKISTPISPTDWHIYETIYGPTMYPSIGNWQIPCQSHYLIIRGKIVWARKWTKNQIINGRLAENKRNQRYYKNLERNQGLIKKIIKWLLRMKKY